MLSIDVMHFLDKFTAHFPINVKVNIFYFLTIGGVQTCIRK